MYRHVTQMNKIAMVRIDINKDENVDENKMRNKRTTMCSEAAIRC